MRESGEGTTIDKYTYLSIYTYISTDVFLWAVVLNLSYERLKFTNHSSLIKGGYLSTVTYLMSDCVLIVLCSRKKGVGFLFYIGREEDRHSRSK